MLVSETVRVVYREALSKRPRDDIEQHVTRTQALKANPIAEPGGPKFAGQFFWRSAVWRFATRSDRLGMVSRTYDLASCLVAIRLTESCALPRKAR
jgi:hypothetical protein